MTDINQRVAKIAGWQIVDGCPRNGVNHWHEGNLCEGYAPPDFLAPENWYLLEKLAKQLSEDDGGYQIFYTPKHYRVFVGDSGHEHISDDLSAALAEGIIEAVEK